jgi:hypothetical protein
LKKLQICTNLLFDPATGRGIVNVPETRSLRTLKVSMDEICEMLVKARYRKSSYENRLMSKYNKTKVI